MTMVTMVIDCLVHLRGAGGEFCSRCGGVLCQEIPALICAIESFCADRMTIMKMSTKIPSEMEVAPRRRLLSLLREALKKSWYLLGIIPKPVDPPPLATFRDKNVTFGQQSRVFKAKNNGHQNFT